MTTLTSSKAVSRERTRTQKEDDRTRVTDRPSPNVGPVFLAYLDVVEVDKIVNHAIMEGKVSSVPPGDDRVLCKDLLIHLDHNELPRHLSSCSHHLPVF